MSGVSCDHHPRRTKPDECGKCGRPMPAERPTPVRSREWEELFIDGAARDAGLAPDRFTPEVRDRMDNAERTYGNTWATRPLRDLITELDEECLDLPGWSALIGQRLYGEHPDVIERALTILRRYAALGAEGRLLRAELERLLLDG